MTGFHGRPFLSYTLELLKEQGIRRVLLVLDPDAEGVGRYVGDGSRWGLRADCRNLPGTVDTGTRLLSVREELDSVFLLTHGTTYWPLPLEPLSQEMRASDPVCLLTVYRNHEKLFQDTVALDSANRVVAYDASGKRPDLDGTDTGFSIVRREALDLFPTTKGGFREEVLPRLASAGRLMGFIADHRHYDVTSEAQGPGTAEFLARRPTVLIDRDGVLNRRPAKGHYVRRWSEWEWLPGALEGLGLFQKAGYRVIVITNQAGVARGLVRPEDLAQTHQQMMREAQDSGGQIHAVYVCPHGPDDGCRCRKPRPGLLFQAQRDFHLDLSRITFVGDEERDREAAVAACCQSLLMEGGGSLAEAARQVLAADRRRAARTHLLTA